MKKQMKKVFVSMLSLGLLVCCMLVLCACSENVDQPSGLRLNEDTQVLTWHKISNAKGYEVQISGEEGPRSIRTNSISLEFLEPGDYEIQVRALGNGVDTGDSGWVSFQYTREVETGLSYRLINNNTEYQLVGVGKATGDVVMEDVYRGKPVTAIADKALSSCTQLTSFVVGKHVKTIGKNAFARCTNLVSITLPESLQSIGAYAFQSCKALQTMTLPGGITEIPSYLFSWCDGLQTVTIQGQLTKVGEYSFSNCSALQRIALPDSVTVIGEYAFSDCVKMTDLQLGAGVEQIQQYAFFNCAALESAVLSEGLQQIDNNAFGNCLALKEIVIPDSCTKIGDEAFRYCAALETITLGQGLTALGTRAFSNTKFHADAPDLVIIGDWVVDTKDKEITAIDLPDNIIGIGDNAFRSCKQLIDGTDLSGIKYVGISAFAYCSSIWDVDFSDALLTIGDYAFNNCTDLKDLYLGKSLQSIGDYAFYGCTKFTGENFDMPSTLTHVGQDAFKNTYAHKANAGLVYVDDWFVGCNIEAGMGMLMVEIQPGTRGIANYALNGVPVLTAIIIPDSVEYIGKGAFYDNYMVGQITLPRNLKVIGDYAFWGCSTAWFMPNGVTESNGITEIPDGTEIIGRSAFYGCATMVGLHIPGTVKTIGDYAFYGCINLGEGTVARADNPDIYMVGDVLLSEGIEHIGNRAFYDCRSLVSITIPDSVTSLGIRAFYKCAKLTEVTLGNGLSQVSDYAFYNCEKLETVNFGSNIRAVGNYAFRGCSALKAVTLPAGVESIGKFAFYLCAGMEKLELPATLVSIGDYALRGCSSIQSVVVPASVTQVGKHAFHGMIRATVYYEGQSLGTGWHARWNTSHRPVVLGAQLSEDGSYVVSFVKRADSPSNLSQLVIMSAPQREGYVCGGFQAPDGTVYSAEQVRQVPEGTVLTVVWTQKAEA